MDDRHRLLRQAAATLPGDTPRLDAELLLAHALGVERLAMLAGAGVLDDAAAERFAGVVARRAAREPVAYITGRRAFWTLELEVTPDVLIPRPDSETLTEAAVKWFADRAPPSRVLDLGTGSGALLLAALSEWPEAFGVGVDASMAALRVARANAARCGLLSRAAFARGDWQAAVGGRFDLVLCNPPYVEAGAALEPELAREPAGALFAGGDGLDAYRRIVPDLARLLMPGGVAVVELGAGQAAAVRAMAPGLEAATRRDLGGVTRALLLWPPLGKNKSGG